MGVTGQTVKQCRRLATDHKTNNARPKPVNQNPGGGISRRKDLPPATKE
jgi:hypothetical protein